MDRQETRFGHRSGVAKTIAVASTPLILGGCSSDLLFPAGDVAVQQADILTVTTLLILLIVIPVMVATAVFAWRYRQSNSEATYRPDWDHSTILELLIWASPLMIIIAVGAITWIGTHTLDPYRRLDRIAPGKAVPTGAKPLEIDVVALDWKWLFIYPEQGIATVNEVAVPVDREVSFRLTASTVMNSFYVPALAGQIYAMPGMETKLHGVLNRPGSFGGFSANYSGAGFSDMRFQMHALSDGDFAGWIARRKAKGGLLDNQAYLVLEKPSEKVPPGYWSSVDPDLFRRVTERCVEPGAPCMGDTMRKDMGHGDAGHGEMEHGDMKHGAPMPDMPMPAPTGTPATTHSHS